MTTTHHFDLLIIGSGTAGLTLALKMADKARVAVLSKSQLEEGASLYAQGGISVVLDKADSLQSHIDDTLRAGGGLCDEDVVRFTVEHARESVEWLIEQGVSFTRDDMTTETYHLTQEGGHSHRRVIHSADATGRAVETTLLDKAKAHPNISLFPYHIGIDLITAHKHLATEENSCLGCYVLDIKKDQPKTFLALSLCSPREVPEKCIYIPVIQTYRPAMELPWAGVPAVESPIWNLSSFTQPAYFILKPNLF